MRSRTQRFGMMPPEHAFAECGDAATVETSRWPRDYRLPQNPRSEFADCNAGAQAPTEPSGLQLPLRSIRQSLLVACGEDGQQHPGAPVHTIAEKTGSMYR